jgi:hypothetical protein
VAKTAKFTEEYVKLQFVDALLFNRHKILQKQGKVNEAAVKLR